MNRALEVATLSIFLLHNHPNDISITYQADINFTHQAADVSVKINITILDHVVVTRADHTSFRELELLKKTRRSDEFRLDRPSY